MWEGRFANLIIWDTNKVGIFANREIKKPELINPDIDFMEEAFIVHAFTLDKNQIQCSEMLSKAGYKNIINGQAFLNKIMSAKIQSDYDTYKKLNSDCSFMINDEKLIIGTGDCYNDAGVSFSDPTLCQDLWAAKKVFKNQPPVHYDIGSRVDGFITHILSFGIKTVLIDIRKLDTCGIENLTFIEEDATELSNLANGSVDSLSALCSLEHFGLGYYGDPVDPESHKKCFKNIQRILSKNGNLYLSVPISKVCSLYFNKCRVYSPDYIINQFDSMELLEFSYTSDNGIISEIKYIIYQ